MYKEPQDVSEFRINIITEICLSKKKTFPMEKELPVLLGRRMSEYNSFAI